MRGNHALCTCTIKPCPLRNEWLCVWRLNEVLLSSAASATMDLPSGDQSGA